MTARTADDVGALRAALIDAEREWDRVDAQGDTAATVRLRAVIDPRIRQIRRALAVIERTTLDEVHR